MTREQRGANIVRLLAALFAITLACTGCMHIKLQSSTVRQGSTLSDLQFQQVLDNLAMFSCNRDALAWHLNINGGLVQITDQGTGGVLAQTLGSSALSPNLAVQRTLVGQWNVDPVVETDDLELLQLAYQKAIDPLDADGTLRRAIYHTICEVSVSRHIVLERNVANTMISALAEAATPQRRAQLEPLRTHLNAAYDHLDALTAAAPDLPTPADAKDDNLARFGPQRDFIKEQILRLASCICELPYVSVLARSRAERNVAIVEQDQDKIASLLRLVEPQNEGEPNPFATPWLFHGCKKEVPKCACYVGHYRGCYGDCYVWVTPAGYRTLRDFTLIILSLAPNEKQDISLAQPGAGAAFTPGN